MWAVAALAARAATTGRGPTALTSQETQLVMKGVARAVVVLAAHTDPRVRIAVLGAGARAAAAAAAAHTVMHSPIAAGTRAGCGWRALI